jgi:hypothetical protein
LCCQFVLELLVALIRSLEFPLHFGKCPLQPLQFRAQACEFLTVVLRLWQPAGLRHIQFREQGLIPSLEPIVLSPGVLELALEQGRSPARVLQLMLASVDPALEFSDLEFEL